MKETILNITNGDSAVQVMKAGDIPGTFLSWRDVLHEGPVPAEISLDALSDVRAKFIAERGWGDFIQIRRDFEERDQALHDFHAYSKVRLWFEHDLYDQLQLLQILDAFSGKSLGEVDLTLICTDQYLGMIDPEHITDLFLFEEAVRPTHFTLAKKAWAAFRAASPEQWRALLDENTEALPFLQGAVLRLLEEYPSTKTGLSRTAQKALEIIAEGEDDPVQIFSRYRETEERLFLGDWSFWTMLNGMLEGITPLLCLPEGGPLALPPGEHQLLSLTAMGEAVLSGKKQALDLALTDRWIGGVHLRPGCLWLWDGDSKTLCQKNE